MPVVNVAEYRTRKCPNGMLDSYMKYAIYQESPPDFHLWVLISMLAGAMGRQCFVNMGMFSTFPNMFIILVGESAITHKSTAIDMGMDPFRDALPEVPQLSQKMSPEALIHAMKTLSEDETMGRAEAYLESSELANLLGQSKLDDGLIKLLTEFWDCRKRFTYMTIARGMETVTDICLNIIGGSTATWLRSSIPESALEGGFFSRLILVHRPPKGEKNPCPTMTAEQREALENVKHDLQCIRNNMQGEFIIDDDAQQMFNEWYHDFNAPEKAESFMRGYYGRKGAFLQKVAMCLSASYSDDMRITYDDMSLALRLLNENEEHTKQMVKYMGTTEQGSKHLHVLNIIRRGIVRCPPDDTTGISKSDLKMGNYTPIDKKGIRHSDLIRKLSYKFSKDDVMAAVDSLHESGDIIIKNIPPRGAKAYVWTGAEEIDE